jgi:hypothetical protein
MFTPSEKENKALQTTSGIFCLLYMTDVTSYTRI